jgi:probable HAF family extracellular repeat protein
MKNSLLFTTVLVLVLTATGFAASFQGLGDLPGGAYKSEAYGISSDGSVVVGYSPGTTLQAAFRWTAEGGIVSVGNAYKAYGVSSNGSVIVGESYSGSPSRQAFRWTPDGGEVGLGYLTGASKSGAYGISADGSVVVGFSSVSSSIGEAFRWTSGGGMVGLGDLAGGSFESFATGISADGSVVVGYGSSASGQEAFYYDSSDGMQSLKDILTNNCGLDLTGWALRSANEISADGLTIVGFGTNPSGYQEAWVATIPEPATLFLLGMGGLALLRKRRAE